MKFSFVNLGLLALLISSNVFAVEDKTSVFATHEINGQSKITSIGVGINLKNASNHFGGMVSMSLGKAEIVTSKLKVEDYLAWELGGKIGFFSDVSLYLEAGVDLGELFGRDHLDEDRYYDHSFSLYEYDEPYDSHSHHTINDSLDAYIGIGGGIDFGHTQINGHVRMRQIDSEHWTALDDVYSGVTLSFSF